MKKERNKRTNFSGNYGQSFQIDSCIFMYLKYIKNCKYFGFEGEEDFEFITKDDKRHYYQAKCGTTFETIRQTDHSREIKKAIQSFEDVKHKDNCTFNVIFNYRNPFSNGPSFGGIEYDSVPFSSPDLKDEYNRFINFKAMNNLSFDIKDVNFHYLNYEGQEPSKYITNEVHDFLLTNNISVGKNDVTSRWFKIIFENGNKEDFIDAGVMAGTVLNLAIKINDLKRIVYKVNVDLDFDSLDKVKRVIFDYFDENDVSFIESNAVRSSYFEYLNDKNGEDNYEMISTFADNYVENNEPPSYFSNFVNNIDEFNRNNLLRHIYKTYVIMLILNEEEIRKVKGAFGYDD